tara:strand:- start:472 stop:708 length:237 start_codon:yes stop_codon:yes gene_type:complete
MRSKMEDKIKINEKEYDVESLNETQQYYIKQLRELKQKESDLRFDLDQMIAAQQVFKNMLIMSTENKDDKDTDNTSDT